MSEIYKSKIKLLKNELEYLNKRIDMLEGLDIDIDDMDISNDLLCMAQIILLHAKNDIENIYLIMYKINLNTLCLSISI